jgi:uncharacterized protein YjiS (DUF1127 family)
VLDSIKQILVKYFSSLLLLITVVGMVGLVYRMYRGRQDSERRYQDLVGKSEELQRLSDYVVVLERQYKTQDALKDLAIKRWQKEAEALKRRIKMLVDSSFTMGGDEQVPGEFRDGEWSVYEAKLGKQGDDSPPVCRFRVRKSDVRSQVYNYEISVDVAVSRDESSGKYMVLTKAGFVLRDRDASEEFAGRAGWRNRYYPLNVSGGTASIDPTEPEGVSRFRWWAPHLNGGVAFGVASGQFVAVPNFGLSISGYGQTDRDLKWKILSVGLGYDPAARSLEADLYPFLYRPFDKLLTNTYVGPGIGWGAAGTRYYLGVMLGL